MPNRPFAPQDEVDSVRPFPKLKELLREARELPPRSALSRLFGISPLPSRLRSSYQSALGEVAIADTLASLGEDCYSRHSIPIGKSDSEIDHLMVGPMGVFTISVQPLAGKSLWVGDVTVIVDSEREPFIRDCEFEAVRATQLLSDAVGERVDVTPCLVVVDPRNVTVARSPKKVAVLTPRELRPWLSSLKTEISESRLKEIRAAAEADSTWGIRAKGTGDVEADLAEFRRIRAESNQARRIRLVWIAGGLIVIWLLIMLSIGLSTGQLFH
ncbi:MAG: NERD domain-containing protein [Microbacteriaceae bacterium]|nr:NERD domain-containing protein [Microbacteriaceae bacterium]